MRSPRWCKIVEHLIAIIANSDISRGDKSCARKASWIIFLSTLRCRGKLDRVVLSGHRKIWRRSEQSAWKFPLCTVKTFPFRSPLTRGARRFRRNHFHVLLATRLLFRGCFSWRDKQIEQFIWMSCGEYMQLLARGTRNAKNFVLSLLGTKTKYFLSK